MVMTVCGVGSCVVGSFAVYVLCTMLVVFEGYLRISLWQVDLPLFFPGLFGLNRVTKKNMGCPDETQSMTSVETPTVGAVGVGSH